MVRNDSGRNQISSTMVLPQDLLRSLTQALLKAPVPLLTQKPLTALYRPGSHPTLGGHRLQNNQRTHLKCTFKLSSDTAMFSEEWVHLRDDRTWPVDERMPTSAKLSQTNSI